MKLAAALAIAVVLTAAALTAAAFTLDVVLVVIDEG
jgi:hypothetical protein